MADNYSEEKLFQNFSETDGIMAMGYFRFEDSGIIILRFFPTNFHYNEFLSFSVFREFSYKNGVKEWR